MIIFKKLSEISAQQKIYKENGISVGFVPTMGALHSGHISLIEQSKKENQITVCSIFVNPAQFNNPEDLKKYPVTIEHDINLLEKWGCDILFLPGTDQIYPPGFVKMQYELGHLETILEGKFRPGHFQGVCLVVDRLLHIVDPDKLYLGQKDFQQCMVIAKLVEQVKISTQIIICPTLREPDGLAMSSRNLRLNPADRKLAAKIFETLLIVKNEITTGDLGAIKIKATNFLKAHGFKTDYIEIADIDNFTLVENWDGREKIVVLIAASLNDIRLIDNLVLN